MKEPIDFRSQLKKVRKVNNFSELIRLFDLYNSVPSGNSFLFRTVIELKWFEGALFLQELGSGLNKLDANQIDKELFNKYENFIRLQKLRAIP
jgi:hypothetical protein